MRLEHSSSAAASHLTLLLTGLIVAIPGMGGVLPTYANRLVSPFNRHSCCCQLVSCPDYFLYAMGKNSLVNCLFRSINIWCVLFHMKKEVTEKMYEWHGVTEMVFSPCAITWASPSSSSSVSSKPTQLFCNSKSHSPLDHCVFTFKPSQVVASTSLCQSPVAMQSLAFMSSAPIRSYLSWMSSHTP